MAFQITIFAYNPTTYPQHKLIFRTAHKTTNVIDTLEHFYLLQVIVSFLKNHIILLLFSYLFEYVDHLTLPRSLLKYVVFLITHPNELKAFSTSFHNK